MRQSCSELKTDRAVLHLDMPRALTTTLRAFDFRVAKFLFERGLFFDQADINGHFWQFTFQRYDPTFGLSHFFFPKVSREVVARMVDLLSQLHDAVGLPLLPQGFDFGKFADSSATIDDAVSGTEIVEFIHDYVDEVSPLLKLDDPELRCISLGVDSANSLLFSCAFARCLRERLPSHTRVVLGKHSYENFSLALRKDDIRASGGLLRYFDHIVFHEEELAAELLQLCERPERQLENCVDESGGQPAELYDRSVYADLLVLPPTQYVWSMPLSRNKCYWKKCTFCVQIKKHLTDRYFDETSEMESVLEEIQSLHQLGFRYFMFNDEAIQPGKLRRLSDFLVNHEIDIKWTPRIIADAEIKEDLVSSMAEAGCFEVLFGLETVSNATSGQMKKVSHNSTEGKLFEMLKRFDDHGISIFLNLIYAFPTESDGEFQRTFQFFQRVKESMQDIFVQFNKFRLFYGTDIFNAPSEFGLTHVEAVDADQDLKLSFDYEDRFGRKQSTPPIEKYFLASIGMSESEYAELVDSESPLFIAAMFQINYASFGLIHKELTSQNLLSNLR